MCFELSIPSPGGPDELSGLGVEDESVEKWMEQLSAERIEFHRSCYMLEHTLQNLLPPDLRVKLDRRPTEPTKWTGLERHYAIGVTEGEDGKRLQLLCLPIVYLKSARGANDERPVGFFDAALLIGSGSSAQWEKEALWAKVSRPLFGPPGGCDPEHAAAGFLRGEGAQGTYRSCNELVFLKLNTEPTAEELQGDTGELASRLMDLGKLREVAGGSKGLVLTFPSGMTMFFPL